MEPYGASYGPKPFGGSPGGKLGVPLAVNQAPEAGGTGWRELGEPSAPDPNLVSEGSGGS